MTERWEHEFETLHPWVRQWPRVALFSVPILVLAAWAITAARAAWIDVRNDIPDNVCTVWRYIKARKANR